MHHAEWIFSVGGRDIGKTYGARKLLITRFIEHGERFIDIHRTKNELDMVAPSFTGKLELNGEFDGYQFKYENMRYYIARTTIEDEKPDWQIMGYAAALTMAQNLKQMTFVNVVNGVFDEAIIDKRKNKYARYLPHEFDVLADVLHSAFREVPGDGIARTVLLIGNACDMINPYFEKFGIDKIPTFGYRWYRNKTVLLDYVNPDNYISREDDTFIGRMLSDSEDVTTTFKNEFQENSNEFVARKTANAIFDFSIIFNGDKFSIWYDPNSYIIYITDKAPKNESGDVWALTNSDYTLDYNLAKKKQKNLATLLDMYYNGDVRFSSARVREKFKAVWKYLGIM